MKLTTKAIGGARPREKAWKLFDGGGLHLEIRPNGAKYWRLAYRFAGKQRRLSLGVYPGVSLKDARVKAAQLREQIDDGIDPSAKRKEQRIAIVSAIREEEARVTNSFEAVARDWFARQEDGWAPKHAEKVLARLERHIFPWLGSCQIDQIEAPELLKCLRRIEARGTIDTAHRAKWTCSQIFRFAIAEGKASRDPAADVTGALTPIHNRNHFASIKDPAEIGRLLRKIDAYLGTYVVRTALKLAPMLMVRPGELRRMEWSEIDFDRKRWLIPPTKLKLVKRVKLLRAAHDQPHIVPLAEQAIEALLDIQPLTGSKGYVFPSARGGLGPMSEGAVTAALKNMGYQGNVMTGHGFRSMATTLLREMGWDMEIINRQLAHVEANRVTAAYNHAQHMEQRIVMMQAWADHLDRLRTGDTKVAPINRGVA